MEIDGYHALANAIVEVAARDYCKCNRKLKRHPGSDETQWEKERIMKFFYSGWFGILTRVDPDYLIRRLNERKGGR